MPLVDLPLPELSAYPGRNPRPADHGAYWEAALRELDAVDPRPELRPCRPFGEAAAAAVAVDCFDLYFDGVGGARIYAKYLRPRGAAGPHPAVLHFHGYNSSSGDWAEKLTYPGALGFALAALDCRGQGGRSPDPGGTSGSTDRGQIIRGLDDPDPRRMLFRQIFLDAVQLARVVAGFPEVDAARLGAFGGSQGGGLTLACAALAPGLIRRAAPANPFLCDYRRVWEMDLARHAYWELQDHFRRFDPRHERAEAIFTRLGYIDVQHLADRIRAEVLFGCGLVDTICPPSTQFAAYNKITSPKRMLVYPDFAHEDLPGFNDAVLGFLGGL